MAGDLDIRQLALAVLACNAPDAVPHQLCGTAFSIGQGFFITAGHVARVVLESPVPCLGFVPIDANSGASEYRQATITDHEVFDDVDMAILACGGGPYATAPWFMPEAPLLTDVIVGGYPYALDLEHRDVFVRAYRGSISSSRKLYQLLGVPLGYELSFPAPRGLSGAPVLLKQIPPVVLGYVIENAQSGMLVLSDRELGSDGTREQIVERYEWLTYGVAVRASAVFQKESRLLRSTVFAHLSKQGLLAH